jgi:hypothetical protein
MHVDASASIVFGIAVASNVIAAFDYQHTMTSTTCLFGHNTSKEATSDNN